MAFAAIYDSGGAFPAKYKKLGFYIVRGIIAFIGGVLAEVYNITNLPAALQIGASTPAVLAALATVRQGPGGGERRNDGPGGGERRAEG